MRHLIVLWLFLPLFVGGCATTSGLLEDKAEGTSKTYSIAPAKAWDAVRGVLTWEDAYDIEEHDEQGCVTADLPSTFTSYGGVVGVWVEKTGKGNSKVTVLTRRKMATTVGTPMTEGEFHALLMKAMKIVKSGKSLPKEEPD